MDRAVLDTLTPEAPRNHPMRQWKSSPILAHPKRVDPVSLTAARCGHDRRTGSASTRPGRDRFHVEIWR